MAPDAYVELAFRPNVDCITGVRLFIMTLHHQLFGDADVSSRLALATHELLENAVRYSADDESRIRLDIERGGHKHLVTLSTWNTSDPTHLADLQRRLDELRAAADPFAHYLELMRRTAKLNSSSGLGLARIRWEADMDLWCTLEGSRVCVRASGRFDRADALRAFKAG